MGRFQDTFVCSYNNSGYNPFLLKGMNEALERVVMAINNREKIVVYGTYHLDGITGISLLMLVLKYLNADVEYYIPDHMNDDYDIDISSIKNHVKYLGASLIITVGCGSNSLEEIKFCKENHIDVIITDFHNIKNSIPSTVIINPNQDGCIYPYKDLSAVGVVYKLVQALSYYYKMKSISKYLDLVMIGTIYCKAPITGENKVNIEEGLYHLSTTNNYGIRALLKVYNINKIDLDSVYKLSNTLIPNDKIIGRMDNSRIAVELFTTSSIDRAEQIAKYLNKEIQNSR